MRHLRLVPLSPDRIAQAYPLVQVVRPALSLEAWRRYARAILEDTEGGSGIATLQDPRGLIAGLFVYRIGADPGHGRTLVAEDFVALDIVNPETVAQSLADALEAVANEHGCSAVHTTISCRGGAGTRCLMELMGDLGHHLEAFHLCKRLRGAG